MYGAFEKMPVKSEGEFTFNQELASFQKSVGFNDGYYSGKNFRTDWLNRIPQRLETVF